MEAYDIGGLTDIQFVLVVIMIIVMVVELIILLRRRNRAGGSKGGKSPMADRAYNSLLAAEKIYDFMLGQGIVSEEARVLLRDARRDQAAGRFDAVLSKSEQAKSLLAAAKKSADAVGSEPISFKPAVPLADLPAESEDTIPEEGMPAIPKPKVPDNYMQAKFIIRTTAEDMKKAVEAKQDVTRAMAELTKAKKAFDAEDYGRALSLAMRAKKILSGGSVESLPSDEDGPAISDISIGRAMDKEEALSKWEEEEGEAPPKPVERKEQFKPTKVVDVGEAMACPSCDAEVTDDDAFCGKCGTKLEFASVCPGCGVEVTPDDAFCRKCGAKLK